MSIYKIAKEAKVSPSTVSRVLNNSPKVKASTRKLVLGLMKKRGFERRLLKRKVLSVPADPLSRRVCNSYVLQPWRKLCQQL